MRFPASFAAALVSSALFLAGSVSAAPIRITGSDLLDGALRKDLVAFGKANDLVLSFDLQGSRLGLETLEGGRADVGLLVFGANEKRPGIGFASSVIGYLTSVVVVPQGVSLTQINYDQLSGVFGASEQNNYRRWMELGALGEWAPRAVSAMALGRKSGLALDLFRYNVLKTPEFKPTVAMLDTAEEAYARLRGEEGGIAILGSPPPPGRGLKVLLLAKGSGDVAYGPTSENLHTGDYPLRLPVHLVFRTGEAGKLGLFIRHLLADETAPALQSVGVIPLPVQARNQLIFDLETK